MFSAFKSITIGTGNILNNEEFKNAKNQKPTQELLTCIKSRFNELKEKDLSSLTQNDTHLLDIPAENDNVKVEDPEGKTKSVVKIFVNEFYEDIIEEALQHVYKVCSTPPHIILAYSPQNSKIHNEKFIWSENDEKAKKNFKFLWNKLRKEKEAGRIEQLGIADIDLDTILELFPGDDFDFSIFQINIVTCCLPPPELVAFCKDREIQLLTHSDPHVIFPCENLQEIDLNGFKVKFVARYLETLVCRGILTKKGFIMNFQNAMP